MATLTLQQAAHTDSQNSTASVPQYSKTSYVLAATGSSSRVRRTYLKFDLSSIPKGSIITSATLSLYSYDADMNWQASVALVARRVTSSWDQTTITHNSQPSNTSTSQASGTFSGYNKWYDFDAKSLVQSIVNNTNYGIVVMASNESTGSLTKAFRCRTKAGADYATSWHANAPKLTVEYTTPSITVTFYGNGATGTGANTGNTSTNLSDLKQTVTYNSAYTAFDLYNVESLFTRTGYVKVSAAQAWRVGSATSTTYLSDSSANFTSYLAGGTQTLKLYANWRARNYILTVKYQNGLPDHVTDGSSSKPHLIYGAQNWNHLSGAITRDGYTFTGYYDAPSGGIQVYDTDGYRIMGTSYWDSSGNYCYAGDMTVYAQWTPWSHKVIFDANGGTGAPEEQTKTYGSTIKISTTIPSYTGHTFQRWDTNKNGGGTPYNPGQEYGYDQDGNSVTLYAQWTPNTYYITYDANGGSGAPAQQSYTYLKDSYIALDLKTPTRSGYKFLGWNKDKNANTVQYIAGANFSRGISENTTLFAVWGAEETFTISFDSNGGSAVGLEEFTQTYQYNVSYTTPIRIPAVEGPGGANVSKFGYRPIKEEEWNTSADGANTGKILAVGETVYPQDLQNLAKEKGDKIVFFVNYKKAGRVAIFTDPSTKKFARPFILTPEREWRRAMTYIYVNDEIGWVLTTEPHQSQSLFQQTQIVYLDVYPAGGNLNIYYDEEGSLDEFYPT